MGNRVRRVLNVKIEDDARVALARPAEQGLVVGLDQPDRAVDHVGVSAAEQGARRS